MIAAISAGARADDPAVAPAACGPHPRMTCPAFGREGRNAGTVPLAPNASPDPPPPWLDVCLGRPSFRTEDVVGLQGRQVD